MCERCIAVTSCIARCIQACSRGRFSQSSLRRGHDNRQTDGETTHPQRFGTLTRHQIRCHAVGAAYAVCPQLAAASAATALQAFCLRTSMRRRMLPPPRPWKAVAYGVRSTTWGSCAPTRSGCGPQRPGCGCAGVGGPRGGGREGSPRRCKYQVETSANASTRLFFLT